MTSVSADRRQGVNSSAAIKVACQVATTANITLSGLQTIDGVALAADDRVLVKDQTTTSENGVYQADTGTWTRAIDFDGAYDVLEGTIVTVIHGNTYPNTLWRVSTVSPSIGSALAFVQSSLSPQDANNVQFIQIATGAVTTTVALKLGEVKSFDDFGAVGDGATNDRAALQTAFDWLVGAARRALYGVASKKYVVGSAADATPLTITSGANFCIFGEGATIYAAANRPALAGNQMLVLTGNTDFYIENLNIDGNRANRVPSNASSFNMSITDSNARGTLYNVHSDNACSDGFYLDSSTPNTLSSLPTDIHFINCEANNAYRNNVTLVNSVRFRDYHGVYKDANGTAPEDGIDVEPDVNTTQGNQDVQLRGTECTGNDGYGISASLSNSAVRAFDIIANSNTKGAILHAAGTFSLDGFHGNSYTTATVAGVITASIDATRTDFRNMSFENIVLNDVNKACVVVIGDSTELQKVQNISGVNIEGGLLYIGQSAYATNIGAVKFHPTAGPAVTVAANSSVVTNVAVQHTAGSDRSISVTGDDVVIDGVTITNPGATSGGTMGVIEWGAGADRGSLRNVTIRQNNAIPANQVAVMFDQPPLVVDEIDAWATGGNYTAATVLSLTNGSANSLISNVRPHPFRNTATWDPANLANNASQTTTVAVTGSAMGDQAFATFSLSLAGTVLTAYVSVAGTVTVVQTNNSGGAVDLASGTLTVWVEKKGT